MTRIEIITRLCEMAAEIEDMKVKAPSSDIHFYLGDLSQEFQKTLNEMQEGGRHE